MIDISDGLQTDLSKLTKASNVGFNVNIDQLPIRKEMLEIDSEDAISMALSGGDDYELCFTIPKRGGMSLSKNGMLDSIPSSVMSEWLPNHWSSINIMGRTI